MKKVFVSGCYDIIHGGHIEFFTQAKALGDYLIVSFANDEVLLKYKGRKSSLPLEHKKRLLESLSMVDEVVVGDNVEEDGLDFIAHFLRIKPDILAVTEDDKYGEQKKKLCALTNTKYVVLPKTLNYEKISTSEIIDWIKAPKEVPLRVDFGGGWLDVPKLSVEGGFIVNCAISPLVSITNWPYEIKSGLGGSAAYSILTGKNAIENELNLGVGWQDPAIIKETGLCVWRSGKLPVLEAKYNPDWLRGKMALLWTGKTHITYELTDLKRNYHLIIQAGKLAKDACEKKNVHILAEAINTSYKAQIDEGMNEVPGFNSIAKKYCGGGYGGYVLYLFDDQKERDIFLQNDNTVLIEPYLKK
ncbi:MAG TPA: adenylyltransferase/cytidyltransferase family protein [Bacteroidota bacterium]|nr:adenylyltransferase/cytidyltransferase family protein [Bacteroidota bacterium]